MEKLCSAQPVGTPFLKQGAPISPVSVLSSLAGTYCCHNDNLLSLEACGTDLTSLLGYSAEELKNRYHNCLLELIPQEEQQEFMQRVAQQLSVGDEVELACQLYHSDGRVIWALNKARRMVSEDGTEDLLIDVVRTKDGRTFIEAAKISSSDKTRLALPTNELRYGHPYRFFP